MASTLEALLLAQMSFVLNPPLARIYQVNSQNLLNNTLTAITMDSSYVDTYSGHSTVTNNTRYTAQVSGYYTALGGVSVAAATTGFHQIVFRVNGTTIQPKTQVAPSPSFETVIQDAITVFLNVGDYLEVLAWQNSGGTLATVVTDASTQPFLDIYWIHQ